jgi:ABC-2 type transport system ATP-binding protein
MRLAAAALAVECRGLTRTFGTRAAVDGVDLEVPTGSVFGFLGPNGAGKTTTVRLILGILRPTAGSVRVLGLDPIAAGERVRAQCGVLLDQVGLYDRLTAWQNLEFAARVARIAPSHRRARIEAALERVDLADRRDERVSAFSKGMRQKLGIARALLAEPRLLVLDEPTSGLDPQNIVMLRELLLSLAQEGGRTIFLCTHLLDEAERLCDRVGIIQGGRLKAVGTPRELGRDGARVRLRLAPGPGVSPDALDLPGGMRLRRAGDDTWETPVADDLAVEALVAALVTAGIGVRAVVPTAESLEATYLRVVGGEGVE